jgi:CubicO group peptidase (beta-lactamase class C family)
MTWSLIRQAAVAMALLLSLGDAPLPTAKPEEVGFSTDRLQRIHEMVTRRIEAKELSGAVTIVARRGRVVHYEANGLMDIESRKPMGKDTLFHLASSTKPITAVAVLILLEEGKLKLTDPVSKYIPEFKNPRVLVESASLSEPMADSSPSANKTYLVPADRDITILDLLTHTSGLASGGISEEEFAKLRQESRRPTKTLADFIPRLGALPLDFQPGTKWRYSPIAGFDTLGRIVEIVSGMTFDQFLRTRLFAPLGMSNTFFQVPEKDQSRVATIYEHTEHGLEKPIEPWDVFPLYFSGSGGLVSTAADYLRFAQMLCNGGEIDGKRILSPWTVDLMLSNNVGDLFLGQSGRPPKGVGFGLGGEVVVNATDAHMRKPNGSYGWDGAFGTYWWVNRKEQMVAIIFIQTPGRAQQYDFDNAVSQAVID